MKKLAQNMTDLVGNTPLVCLKRLDPSLLSEVSLWAKLEFFNPAGSVKDRIGYGMIKDAAESNLIGEQSLIIEATSGNTGIALAWICAAKGYRLALTMPDSMSSERVAILRALGAEVYLTPAHLGMLGAIDKSADLLNKNDDSLMLKQFENPSNPDIHRKTTAMEIWNDTQGEVDIFIAGVGTGGTITGVGEGLKQKKPSVQIIAVEPASSAVLSGKPAGSHMIQGIGAGFIPKILNQNIIDEIICVTNEQAKQTTCDLARREGIFAGISSGANVYAACQVASRPENKNKSIVAIIGDLGDRYLSMNIF